MEKLLKFCPTDIGSKGVFQIDQRGQDAVIALGIYFLESDFQHINQILPYLINLLKGLHSAVWLDEIPISKSDSKYLFDRCR